VAIPGVISFAAMVLSFIAAISCKFFSSSYGGGESLMVGLLSVETFYAGNLVAGDTYCVGWREATLFTEDDMDGPLKAARAFGIISFIIGFIAFVMIVIPSCVAFEGSSWNQYLMVICGLSIFAGIATLLDLIVLSSSLCKNAPDCTLQSAGISSIVGGALWLLTAGFVVFAMKFPRTIRRDEQATLGPSVEQQPPEQPVEQKEVKVVENDDGTKTSTTTTTIVNADGSKTVTETTETIPAETA
jgi:vacuolar-type H+-ATPase subunit I/STV1